VTTSEHTDASEFWAFVRATKERLEHEQNLAGFATAKCEPCKGSGESEPGYVDYDSHGSIWRSPVRCRACGGHGRVRVKCSIELEIAATEREIAKWQEKLDALKLRAGSNL
jgi:hypothetical protein